jgi:hypothetical protein
MTNPELRPAPFVEINAIFREQSLAELRRNAAVEPERYVRATARAEEVVQGIQTYASDLLPSQADVDQLTDALTKVLFRFDNPHDPADGVTDQQLTWLCFPPDGETCPNYGQRVDTLASYLYAYGGEGILGAWDEGVTSARRFYDATCKMSEDFS